MSVPRRQFLAAGSLTAASLLLAASRPGVAAEASAPPSETPPPDPLLPASPAPPSPETDQRFFPGFVRESVPTSGATINVLRGGKGAPLLLIHGHPETHVNWHKVAGELAKDYTVILPDLRGYGDSSKPEGGENSVNYSFRAMALDQVEVMHHLGFDSFFVAGHDRGGRVVHRLCLDHPNSVRKATVMDVAPTLTMYRDTTKEFATKYVWWFLQIQPFPFPEHLISLDPAYYLKEHLQVQNKTPGAITPEALAEYLRCYCCTGTIHAICEDYRAAAGIDLEQDEADDKSGKKVTVPFQALWGAKGVVGKLWNVLATWKPKVEGTLTGQALDCGHLLPEEQPAAVIEALRAFCT